MVALHPSIPLPLQYGLLLRPQYYFSIIDCLLGSLEQLCLFWLGQTFLIEPVQALTTNSTYIILLCRSRAPSALVIQVFELTLQSPLFRVPFGDVWFCHDNYLIIVDYVNWDNSSISNYFFINIPGEMFPFFLLG